MELALHFMSGRFGTYHHAGSKYLYRKGGQNECRRRWACRISSETWQQAGCSPKSSTAPPPAPQQVLIGSSSSSAAPAPAPRPPSPPQPILPPTITIPPLACSQTLRVHPSYDVIREKADAWMLSVANPASGEAAEVLVQSLFPLVTCAVHAEVEESLCLVAAKIMAWAFLFEDIVDEVKEGMGDMYPAAKQLLHELDQSLLRPGEIRSFAHITTQHESLLASRHHASAAIDVELGWWNELRTHMSPAYQSRYLRHMQELTSATATEVAWRHDAVVPDLHTYIVNRRIAAAIIPAVTVLECGLGVEFDESILDCTLVTQLKSAACDYAAWVNDLISFKKEYVRDGNFCNILAVVWLRPSSPGYGDLQKSVNIVAQMIAQRDRDFQMLLMQAEGCPALMEKPGMAKYLRGIGDWLSGHRHWAYATARYYDGADLENPRLPDSPLTMHLV